MTKYESRIGVVKQSDEKIYNYLSDFNNFKDIVPSDKLKDYQSTEESCSFTIDGLGRAGMEIIEKKPNELIKITGDEDSKLNFFFWVQIKQVAEMDSRIKLTIKAELNPMLKMVASKPIQSFLDKLIDQLETFSFEN